jgi:DNA-binding transcriptional LysR family regulator
VHGRILPCRRAAAWQDAAVHAESPMNIEGLSLDQMRVALAVASTGSFPAAARQFRRAQSAVSCAITTLEAQLGTRLFDRSGPRARVAPEGVALLAEMAAIVARADALRQQAQQQQQ